MKVTFENATIADSVGKAARVAPTRGMAFDKASGILMTLDPEEGTVTLKATNLNLFYLEVVDAVEVEGEGTWRFPSMIISAVLAKLPIGSGKTVTLEQKGNSVELKSGRTTAKFRTMEVGHYPDWEPFDPDKLEMVPDFGARIQQVEWAALDEPEAIYAGIHLDGTVAIATDRFRMAMVECEAEPIYKPITIPSGILQPIVRNLRDVAIGIDEGQFLMMPDVSTQIRTIIYDKVYPPVQKAFDRTWPNSVKIRKQPLLDAIDRAVVFVQGNRSPSMTFIIGKDEIAVMCSDQDMGLLGEVVDLNGQADHKRHKVLFTPKNLTDALNAAPSEEVIIHYNTEESAWPFKIDGGSGYTALAMPRQSLTKE
jgi:DNA polymerase III sliding clamp (beta) subunit (PCNA family)